MRKISPAENRMRLVAFDVRIASEFMRESFATGPHAGIRPALERRYNRCGAASGVSASCRRGHRAWHARQYARPHVRHAV